MKCGLNFAYHNELKRDHSNKSIVLITYKIWIQNCDMQAKFQVVVMTEISSFPQWMRGSSTNKTISLLKKIYSNGLNYFCEVYVYNWIKPLIRKYV